MNKFITNPTENVGNRTITPNSTERTLNEVFTDYINVINYGLDNTGLVDNSPALQLIIDNLDGGGTVYFPVGEYLFNTTISTTKHVSFIGSGVKNTELVFDGCDGLKIDRSANGALDDQILIRDISILTKDQGLYVGLELMSFESTSPLAPKCVLQNINLHGYDIASNTSNFYEWKTAIYMHPCDKAALQNIYITGQFRSSIYDFPIETVGILMEGSTGVNMTNVDVYRTYIGIKCSGQSEGMQYISSVIVATFHGIYMADIEAPSNNHSMRGLHIAAEQYCIYIEPTSETTYSGWHNISNCFFLQRAANGNHSTNSTGDGMANWMAINASISDSTINSCSILSNINSAILPVTDGNYGIKINAGTSNVISIINATRCGTSIDTTSATNTTISNVFTNTSAVQEFVGISYDNSDTVMNAVESDGVLDGFAPSYNFSTQGGIAFKIANGDNDTVNYLQVNGTSSSSNYVAISAKTTDDNYPDQDLRLSGSGNGLVRFGVKTDATDPATTGYITIKDSSGNTIKLAVVS